MKSSRRNKIIIDLAMTVLLVLSFVRWEGESGAAYHFVVGTLCAIFFALHIYIHRKWLRETTKKCLTGKLSKALGRKYGVNVLLLLVWGVSIVTGFAAVAPFFAGHNEGIPWGQIHGITARVGLVLIIIHVIQHIPQIKSYLGLKKRG